MPKAFRFRMERLLELRRLQEERKSRDLAEANRAVVEQQEKILKLWVEEDGAKLELRRLRVHDLDLTAIRIQEQYLSGLGRRIWREVRDLDSRQQKSAEKRREWSEAAQGVRVLERLRDRRHAEYVYEVDREERKFLDEIAQRSGRS